MLPESKPQSGSYQLLCRIADHLNWSLEIYQEAEELYLGLKSSDDQLIVDPVIFFPDERDESAKLIMQRLVDGPDLGLDLP